MASNARVSKFCERNIVNIAWEKSRIIDFVIMRSK